MRKTFTLSLIATAFSLSAQLQNGGFEDLSSQDFPTFWTAGMETVTIGDIISVDSANYLLNTTDVHSGLNAVELRNAYNYTQEIGLPGQWIASNSQDGYDGFSSPYVPIAERPVSMRFWAKYAPVLDDMAYAEVKVLDEFEQEIGFGSLNIGGTVSTYTAYDVPVVYSSAVQAAFIQIRFITMVPGGNAHLGTRILVDDVEVNYTATGIGERTINALTISPNPATDVVRISGLTTGTKVTVRLFNSGGQLEQTANVINGALSVDALPNGAHLLQVEQDGQRYEAPLMIAR